MCIVSKFSFFDRKNDIPLLVVALSLSRSPNNIIVELNIYDAFIRSLCLTKSLLAFSLCVLCYDPLRSWRVVECHKFWLTLLAVWVDEHSSLDFIIIIKKRKDENSTTLFHISLFLLYLRLGSSVKAREIDILQNKIYTTFFSDSHSLSLSAVCSGPVSLGCTAMQQYDDLMKFIYIKRFCIFEGMLAFVKCENIYSFLWRVFRISPVYVQQCNNMFSLCPLTRSTGLWFWIHIHQRSWAHSPRWWNDNH